MKIAILYIAIGEYVIFWKDFYISAEKYFYPNINKEYFVFTDADSLYADDENNVHMIEQENLGWPGNTLKRFGMFNKITDRLEEFDYVCFFNANYLFIKEIAEGFFPDIGLVMVQHPGYYDKEKEKFPYERNNKSLAYISYDKGEVYVQGCLNGGTSKDFIKLIKTLAKNVEIDIKNGIVAKWHDESHLNNYIINHKYKLLNPGFAYPEGWDLPFEKQIITRDKHKYGSYDKLRGINESKAKKINNMIFRIIDKVKDIMRA